MRHIFPFFCEVVAWRKIPGRSEYIQGRRKVYKSEGASKNVVGIICPQIEIRLTYLPEFGGVHCPRVPTALRYTRQRSTWEGPHHLNFFDDHASGIGYLRFRQQKARLASFLNVPTANLGLIP